ncbi:MAG: alpha/beta fold hydrolase [Acidimicrobiia bacterium]
MSKLIAINGVELSVDDQGEGLAVVLIHGFPELAYSWRHQVPALVDAGYRVISYDARGYGASSKPDDLDAYTLTALVDDVIGILDYFELEDATLIAHDWGTIVMYSAAVAYPERVSRIVSLTAPYRGACWGFPPISAIKDQLADRFAYILMFHHGDAAERGFEADPDGWLNAFYLGGSRGKAFMTDEEFRVYADAFIAGGITGPVNWYRNIDRNNAEWAHHLNAVIDQPTLVIASDDDPVLPVTLLEGMGKWVPKLETTIIANTGHWTQQESPVEVNEALVAWLRVADG